MEITLKQALECVLRASTGGNIGISRQVVEALSEGYNADYEINMHDRLDRDQLIRKDYVQKIKTVRYFRLNSKAR